MKNNKIRILVSLIISLTMIANTLSIYAANYVYKDNYESYTPGTLIDNSVYAYKLLRNVASGGDETNKYIDLISKVSLTPEETAMGYVVKPGRIIQEFTNAPTGKFIVSVDFMTPRSIGNNAELFSVQYRDGNGYIASVYLRDNRLFTTSGSNQTPIEIIHDNIEANRWYNAQVLVDTDAKTYQVKCENEFTEPQEFVNSAEWLRTEVYDKLGIKWKESYADIMRIFSVTNNSPDIHIFIDNGTVALLNNPDLDIATFEAYSMLVNKTKGLANGMYPSSVFSMLEDVYTEAYEKGKQSNADPEELTLLEEKLLNTIEVFNNNRIDTSSPDGIASYITTSLPKEAIVYNEGGFSFDLNANSAVFDKSKTEIEESISWKVTEETEGIQIEDGVLTVSPETEGTITLIGSAGDIYDKFSLKLLAERSITVNEFSAFEGLITIKGSINKEANFPVIMSLTGDIISFENETLYFDDNGCFEWRTTLPEAIGPEDLVLTIEGEDITKLVENRRYYGMDWASDMTARINASDDVEKTEQLLTEYLFGLNIDDKDKYNEYSQSYAQRVYDSKNYSSAEEIYSVITESNCVIALKDSTRQNIQTVIDTYIDYLAENNFDESKFNKLSSSKKSSFYVEAAGLSFDEKTAGIKDITDELNEITDDLYESSSGSSGGGGGGGGSKKKASGSVSAGPVYNVTPITDPAQTNNTNDTITTDTAPFEDIELAEWAKDALMYLKSKNIMVGYNNKVRPNDYVTRGEFTKMLVTAFELTAGTNIPSFTDSQGAWWKEYADIAASNGIINGFSDGSFGGDSIINREMLAVMTDRVITAKEIELYDKNEANKNFKDSDSISDYAKESVSRLFAKGVVSGIGDNLFAPKVSVTRAEAAQIIYNVLTNK